jgi:hypothetical protein
VGRKERKTRGPGAWSERVFEVAPVSPAALGVGIGVALVALFFALVAATGDLGRFLESDRRWWEDRDGRLGVLLAALAAYLVVARHTIEIDTRRNLEALRSAFPWRRGQFESATRDFAHRQAAPARLAALSGVALVPIAGLLIDRDPLLYFQSGYWGAAQAWSWGVGAFAGWNGGVLFQRILSLGRRFSALARQIPGLDLLDLTPLTPFSRQGLRSALPPLILLSGISLNVLDRGFLWAIAVLGTFSLAVLAAALLLPLQGVRQRIRQLKREELSRIDAAVKGDLAPLAGSAIRRRAQRVSLTDLLAYRQFVESVREWPFDAPTRFRVVVYLALPLVSWLGGAFVERLLEAALS